MTDEEYYLKKGKKVFRYRAISHACLIFALVSPLFVAYTTNFVFLAFLTVGFLAAYIILSALFWKCPKCNRHFEMREGPMDNISICPYCGVKLREPHYKD